MSDQVPEPGGGGGSFFTKKFAGIPAWAWMAAAALIAYMYFRHKSSSSTANKTGQKPWWYYRGRPITEIFRTNNYYRGDHDHDHDHDRGPHKGPYHHPAGAPPRVYNAQPRTPEKNDNKQNAQFIVVGRWPGQTTNGLAAWNTTLEGISEHTGVPVTKLYQLNPQIQNPDLLYPGEQVRISDLWTSEVVARH
ncbi:MAG TPA: LysM peptidoglycan-binding domain-containing protein [Puia sp.]|nr:LysM peptidoglycan-binding domain-containing protein [Puia sp.]